MMANKNAKKNVNKKKALENLKPYMFTKDKQPLPEAKKRGWKKKQAKDAIVQAFDELALSSWDDIRKKAEDIKIHPEKYTVVQVKVIKYLLNGRLDVDFINRGLEYAKQKIDVENKGDVTLRIIRKILDDDPRSNNTTS